MQHELNAIADPRVIPIPQDLEAIRRGIFQIYLAENLKRLRGNLARIRRKPMSNFEAVLIGLMLVVTRESVADRRRGESQQQNRDGIDRQRSPIRGPANFPRGGMALEPALRDSRREEE